jgi:glycosyltransferase involved in cell wall biosynthesis
VTEPRVVIIVPCYVEATRLTPAAFLDFLPARPWLTLLFVDDGSHDGTLAVLERMAAARPEQVRVLRLEVNSGKAEAVRAGILQAARAEPDYVGFWDADLSTPIDAIDDFVALVRSRPDVDLALGSRVNLMGRDIRRSLARHYLSRVFATAASEALDLPVYDTQCGAKLIRASGDVLSVFAQPFRSRWVFDVEILERYLALPVRDGGAPRRARIYELPLQAWHEVPGSKLRTSDFLWSFVEVFGVWRRRRGARGLRSLGAGELRGSRARSARPSDSRNSHSAGSS